MPDKLLVRAVSSMAALAFILLIAGQAQNPARQSQGQQKQDETVARIETELVQIDVVVTDKKGQPVRDLKREGFQLFEDGKPQTITHFAVSTAARPADWLAADAKRAIKEGPGKELPGKESPGKEAPIKEPAVSNNPAATQTGRYLVLAVDDLSLIPPHLLDVKRTLRRFIDEQMVGGDQAAIMTTSGNLGLLQQFTTDRYLLRHAIDRLQIRNPAASRPAFPHISDYQAELIEANDREALSIAVEELLSSRQAILDSEEFINHLIEKNDPIVQQARSLARRIVTDFSDHVDLNLKPESFEQAMKNGLSYRRLVTLQPGLYQLRLAVREEATAQIGSAFQWVEIGDLSKKQPRLSSLIFTSEKDDLSSLLRSEAQREGVVSYDQPRLAQTSRRFKRGGHADFLVFVYNAGTSGQGAGDVFIRKELSAGGRLINTSKPVAIGSSVEQFGEVIPYTERLLLDALAAGDYELRITLSDRAGKVMDSRGIGFTVE